MADGSVKIDTRMDTKAVQRGVKDIRKSLLSLEGLIAKVFSVAALIRFGKKATELASDIQEVQNVVDTAFGQMSYKIEEFAETSIENFGMSKLSAKQMGSTFMAMARGMGQALDVASDMSVEMTGRMGDIASFYNKSLQEVETIGRAVYSGETEPLKQIGVIMTEAQLQTYALAKGYKKLYKDMSASEKLLIRQKYFLEQTSLAAGDFVRTQDSWANQTRILNERWKEFMSIVGSGLIAVLTPLVKMLNQIVQKLIDMANAISKVFGSLSHSQAKENKNVQGTYEDLTGAVEGYGDAVDGATKSVSKSLSKMDELNELSSGKTTAASSENLEFDLGNLEETADKLDSIDDRISAILARIKELAQLFKKGFFEGLGDYQKQFQNIKDNLNLIKKSLMDIFTDPRVANSFNNWLDSLALNAGRVAGSFASVGITIAQNLVGGIAKYLSQNTERIKQYLITMFDTGSVLNETVGSFRVAIANIFSAFGGENGQQLTANIIGIFADAFMGISELLLKFQTDYLSTLFDPITENAEELKGVFDDLLGFFASIFGTLKKLVDDVSDKLNQTYDQYIHPKFEELKQTFTDLVERGVDLYNQYIAPFLDHIAEKVSDLYDRYLHPAFDKIITFLGQLGNFLMTLYNEKIKVIFEYIEKYIMPILMPALEALFDFLGEGIGVLIGWIGDLFAILGDLIEFITNVFTGDFESAFQKLQDIVQDFKDFFKDVGNGIISIAEVMANGIIKAINGMIGVLNNLSIDIPDWVPSVGGNSIGFNIPTLSEISIPRLATGTVIPTRSSEFLAMLGDNNKETEVVSPLSTMKEAFLEAIKESGINGSNNITVVLEGDAKGIFKVVRSEASNYFDKNGYSAFPI